MGLFDLNTPLKERICPGFDKLLRVFSLEELENHHDPVYGLWPDLRLAYLNPAWFRFAAENTGEPAISTYWNLGASVMEAIAEDLRPFYQNLFEQCLQPKEGLRPLQHEYECSSGSLYRRFQLSVYPLRNHQGLLIVNALVVERLHDPTEREPRAADKSSYADQHGLIHQCCHCRRVQNQKIKNRWDWVPQWVDHVPRETSHTLCPLCLDYYYPEDEDEDERLSSDT